MYQREIEVLPGICLTMQQITPQSLDECLISAKDKMSSYINDPFNSFPSALLPSSFINLQCPQDVQKLYLTFLVFSLADKHIIKWSGIENENGAPISTDVPHAKHFVVQFSKVQEAFIDRLFAPRPDLLRRVFFYMLESGD